MGNLCGRSYRPEEGQLLDPSHGGSGSQRTERTERPNQREAAAAAAENRMKAQQNRGVQSSNPHAGRLAAQLEASKSSKEPPQEIPERVVWD